MRQIAAAALSLALLLASPSHGQQRCSLELRLQTAQLFYVFSPDDALQLLGARRLQDWTLAYPQQLRVIGILQRAAGSLEQFRLDSGLSFELLSVAEAQQHPDLPGALAGHLDSEAGYALLVDAAGQQAAAGSGAELPRVMGLAASLLQLPIPTEVDESTWGKVKEIFK